MNELEINDLKTFDNIKHIDENGNEYWEKLEFLFILL